MFVVTRYCVQAFARRRGILIPDQAQQFRRRELALAAGNRAARWAAGVAVFQVDGETESGFWREPRLLAMHGETPRLGWRSAGPKTHGAEIVSLFPSGPR